MKTLILILTLSISSVSFSQSKPTKFQIFSTAVNADGSEITTKEGASTATHSAYTFAVELASVENVTKFHLALGTDEANASSLGSWVVPFDVTYNENGITVSQRGNVVYVAVGHHANSSVYATVKTEYADGATSANVVYTR